MTALRLFTASLRQHPWGSAFIVLLIAATTALSMAVSLQERALREGSARAADQFDLVIGAPGSEIQLVLSSVFLQASDLSLLTPTQIDNIAKNPLASWSSPIVFGDYYQERPIVGVNHDLLSLDGKRRAESGRFFTHHNEAVVGARSGLKIGDTITPIHGNLGDADHLTHEVSSYTVVGVLPVDGSVWDQAILVPIESVWLMHAMDDNPHSHLRWQEPIGGIEPQGAPAVIVKPQSVAGAYQLRSQYRGNGTQAVFPGEVLVRLYSTLGDAKKLLSGIAIITQLLVALAVSVIIAIYLQQQQRQIAALRAFGAPRNRIFLLIWGALLMLISIAIILGAIGGYALAAFASNAISAQNGFILPVQFNTEDMRFLAILFIIGAIALLIPSLYHYRRAPAEILRDT
ncbi:ABC transporter permease [Suttonella sp. R2A3]|uniref:ABC transporter permease n=1 Tax=Suttonella sp. R2A3 TaxID=2908648 RepID=UPI001F1701B9|nr:ABC transporter permease [Suttonella sp. R2A3]UJF24376.1 ABC transporter permease [Suttonella sp. R2A3]